MIILRCTNDNGVVADLPIQESLDLLLDISAIENGTIGDVYGISSQEFAIPGTDLVNQFFGNIYNLGATPSVALQNSIDCQVLYNGAEVFTGKLYINNVITDQQGFTIYNVVVVNETVDFKFEIQDKLLTEYDFSRFNHNFTYANVSASWSGNLLQGSIVYPFIEYGIPEADADAPNYEFASFVSSGSNTIDNYDSPLRLEDFKPAIRAKDVIDVIFSGSSYEYTSSFFNSEYFESLYLLTTPDDTLGPTNVSPVSQSVWAYNASGSQTIIPTAIAKVEFDAEVVDNSNRFNLSTDRYTAATTGNYQYQINVNYTIANWSGINNQDRVTLQLRLNGGSIIANQSYIFPPATGSAFLQGAVQLNPGDYLEVELFYQSSNAAKVLTILNEIGKPAYLPNGYVTYFQMRGPATSYGTNVNMAGQFPDDLKAQDFLEGLIEKFNLVVEPVPNSRNLIRIEPYQDWVNAGAIKDWTDKVDRNIRFEISHPIQEQPRTITFSDEEDEDILNKFNVDNTGRVYGSYTFVSDSDLAEGERRVGKIFAATPVTGIPNGRTFIIPHLCTSTDLRDRRPYKFKPRLLYNNGLQPVPVTALGIQGTTSTRGTIFVRDENATVNSVRFWNQMSTLTSVPVNYNTGQDLHFNNDLYTPYFQASANGKVKADAYRTYWATYINSLYDVDARKLKCNVYIKPTEIQDIALNDKIFIDGAYYRINRISGANLSRRDSVEVELLKVVAQQLKFPRRRVTTGGQSIDIALDYNSLNVNGTGRYVNTNTGEFVDSYSAVRQAGPKDGLRVFQTGTSGSAVWDYQQPIDASNLFSQTVLGNNTVEVGASKVNAVGNNNLVKEGSEVSLVVGANNSVRENTYNATVVGQSHTIGEGSNNAQLFGGFGNEVTGSNNSVSILGGSNSSILNGDYSTMINGEFATLRDCDFTTAINSHTNEVIINGSGHTVIGLNKEGGGLDLLEYRNNSNYLGDTYLGGALFSEFTQLECGDGKTFYLTGSNPGQGKHDHIFVLNWSGLSPGTTTIELPSAINDDYNKIIYRFVTNGSFDGTTQLIFNGFSGQTINGSTQFKYGNSWDCVTFFASGSGWITLDDNTKHFGSFYSTIDQSASLANTAYSMSFNTVDIADGVTIASGSRIYPNRTGTYNIQFSAQYKKNTGGDVKVYTWLAKNGTNVANSNTEITIAGGSGATAVAAWNFFGSTQNTSDFYELRWGTDTAGTTIEYLASPVVGPAIPSIILTVDQIS